MTSTNTDARATDEKLDEALQEIRALRKAVEDLSKRLDDLEEPVKESHEILIAFSQSYYWTPEWQAKEARADEDLRLGRYKTYDDVEEFIKEMNQ